MLKLFLHSEEPSCAACLKGLCLNFRCCTYFNGDHALSHHICLSDYSVLNPVEKLLNSDIAAWSVTEDEKHTNTCCVFFYFWGVVFGLCNKSEECCDSMLMRFAG